MMNSQEDEARIKRTMEMSRKVLDLIDETVDILKKELGRELTRPELEEIFKSSSEKIRAEYSYKNDGDKTAK